MKRSLSLGMVSAAAIIAAAGAASQVLAVDVGYQSVYTWTGSNYGAGVGNAPGAIAQPGDAGTPTWAFAASSFDSQPQIDPTGRIYARIGFTPTPSIVGVTSNPPGAGIFTATNHTDLNLYQRWATGLDAIPGSPSATDRLLQQLSTAGTYSNGLSSNYRVSGSAVGLGEYIANPATNNAGINRINSGSGATALLQNNSLLFSGNLASQSFTARMGDVIALPTNTDWTVADGATANFNGAANYGSGGQFQVMNASGTWLVGSTLATIGPNPATAATSSPAPGTTGNASFLGTISAGGSFNVIARAGDTPFGAGDGRVFKGGNNGVGGFYQQINRNGQAAYDASFLGTTAAPGPGGVTTNNDSTAWIYTPGAGARSTQNVRIYREAGPVPGAAPGTVFTGGISAGNKSFSNFGLLYSASTVNGDTVTGTNDSMLMISTASGGTTPVWTLRRGATAPGFAPADNVNYDTANSQNLAINNSGRIGFMGSLKGAGVIQPVAPVYTIVTIPPPSGIGFGTDVVVGVTSQGLQGNNSAVFYGNPGVSGPTGLRAIARTGDLAPGFGGAFFEINPSYNSVSLNNNGDMLFASDVTNIAPGQMWANWEGYNNKWSIGQALFAYVAATDSIINLLYPGQSIEVEPGVYRTLSQYSVNSTGNGDGTTAGFNDAGQFVAWCRFTDNSTSYIVLNIPAPATGAMAFLGLGVAARRRRRN